MPFLNSALAGFEKYLPKSRTAMDGFAARSGGSLSGLDAATAGGMVFLQGELEKYDARINEPIAADDFWQEDIPVVPGGGWVDWTNMFNVNYGISGPNLYGLQANQNSEIPIIQADMGKSLFPVYPWQNMISITWLDLKKYEQAPRNIMQLYDNGVTMNWNFACQEMTYFGMAKLVPGTQWTGLVNDPNVPTYLASAVGTQNGATAGTAASRLWANKTPQQVANDLNAMVMLQATAVAFQRKYIANTLLIDPIEFGVLLNTPFTLANGTATGFANILDWLEHQAYGASQGVPFKIKPRPFVTGAGVSGSNRAVLYRNDPSILQLDIPVVAQRTLTQMQLDQKGGRFNTLYAGNIGVVKKRYPASFYYLDNA